MSSVVALPIGSAARHRLHEAAMAVAPPEAEPHPCAACGGDGSVPIEPIREVGGVIWSIMPCEVCWGSGLACDPV